MKARTFNTRLCSNWWWISTGNDFTEIDKYFLTSSEYCWDAKRLFLLSIQGSACLRTMSRILILTTFADNFKHKHKPNISSAKNSPTTCRRSWLIKTVRNYFACIDYENKLCLNWTDTDAGQGCVFLYTSVCKPLLSIGLFSKCKCLMVLTDVALIPNQSPVILPCSNEFLMPAQNFKRFRFGITAQFHLNKYDSSRSQFEDVCLHKIWKLEH